MTTSRSTSSSCDPTGGLSASATISTPTRRSAPHALRREKTLRFARRMALISPEALAQTKLAINRGADAMGFTNAMHAGLDVVAPLYAARTDVGVKFTEIRQKEGLRAALKWRRDQFAQY